jgi:PAS domain S-box-containing protein
LWWALASLVTYYFWDSVFSRAPFMMFFAAVAITTPRSGGWMGMLVATGGIFVVLTQRPEDVPQMLVPSLGVLFNAAIIIFLSTVVRQGMQMRQDAQTFRQSIGEAVADFLWSWDPDGSPLYANDRMISYLGISMDELKKKGWQAFVHPQDLADLAPELADMNQRGVKLSWPVRYRQKDGSYRWFQCRAVPVRDRDGALIRWVGTSTEIHEQYLAEQEREEALRREKEARLEAEAASRMKDEFLATISHELRTPLNAVFGWLHLLKDPETSDEEMKEGLEIIDRNVRVQGQLVNDLLDMSGMITGKVRLNLQMVDFAKIVRLSIESATPSAGAKGITIESDIATSGELISGDEVRLQQVVWNILSNAIKFTPPGGRVDVSLAQKDASLELTIKDSGEGIDPTFLSHVFERFRQADASVTRAHGGLGLGLAITWQLVDLHRGTIRAESEGVGRGATFRVTLPLGKNSPVSEPATA